MDFVAVLAREFSLRPEQVRAVIELLDAGNTVPFIARYRKEATGSLDDQLLRELTERLEYLRSLDKRRMEIEKSLAEQQVLTDELRAALAAAATLAELEDIYRPFRPKRRTRATIARERGLEGLAQALLLQQPFKGTLETLAAPYINNEKDVPDAESALAGARDIIAETISDDAALRKVLRGLLMRDGVLTACAAKEEDSVYSMYYAYSERVPRVADHRVLAINRGEKEGFLKVSLAAPDETANRVIAQRYVRPGALTAPQVAMAAQDAWDRLIFPSLEREVRSELTDRANVGAIRVFSQNLQQLLMQPPIKGRVTLGVDPGFRTGCKLAVVDENGKVLETGVGHFTLPGQTRQQEQARQLICGMVARHHVTAIAIGNGTASRESEQFIASLLPSLPQGVAYTIVSEAGASVYSASKLAAQEFPDFDVSLRSAVSIARRMQDPLAELVKIDPRSIGVGQYQHDLKQNELTAALDGVVEHCVNSVGVELSTASAELLSHVAGIGPASARMLHLLPEVSRYYEHDRTSTEGALTTTERLVTYLKPRFAGARQEKALLLSLDSRSRVKGVCWLKEGNSRMVGLEVKDVVSAALRGGTESVVLCHNHPNGVPLPSREDLAATENIVRALGLVKIRLRDHIILAENDYFSMRESNRLPFYDFETGAMLRPYGRE